MIAGTLRRRRLPSAGGGGGGGGGVDFATCGQAVVVSIVIWAVGGAFLALYYVHDHSLTSSGFVGRQGTRGTATSSLFSSASSASSTSTVAPPPPPPPPPPRPVLPRPANYCDAHGPHTLPWGGPESLVYQGKLPLIAIAVATTSRHMEDRNGPGSTKVKFSELKRRGQVSSDFSSLAHSGGLRRQSTNSAVAHRRQLLSEGSSMELRHVPPRLRRSSKIRKINGTYHWQTDSARLRRAMNVSVGSHSSASAAAAASRAVDRAADRAASPLVFQPDKFSLFRILLPSVTATLECGFRYAVVIGFDLGDPLYDNATHRRSIRDWFGDHVASPARYRGIDVAVAFARVNNTLRKPGPAFTAMTRAAFDDVKPVVVGVSPSSSSSVSSSASSHHARHAPGRAHPPPQHVDHSDADAIVTPGHPANAAHRSAGGLGATFCYRINDDSEFLGPWASKLSTALLNLGPPYGVVGPLVCNRGGNHRILTHDFVHRDHMTIFGRWYYPPELADWWMDAWISRVYGRRRTVLVDSVLVRHRTKEHGRRYAVSFKNKEKLEALVEIGKAQIAAHMRNIGVDLTKIERFLADHFDGNSADASTRRDSAAGLRSCSLPE